MAFHRLVDGFGGNVAIGQGLDRWGNGSGSEFAGGPSQDR